MRMRLFDQWIRSGLFAFAADGGAGGGAGGAPAAGGGAPAPAPAPTPAAPAPAVPPDLQALLSDPTKFAGRLEESKRAGQNAALQALGFKSIEEAKAAIDAHRAAEEAKKTELQKATEKAAALEKDAAEAKALRETIGTLLETEEKAIPPEKAPLLDKLAPPKSDPAARLKWIATARAEGIFGAAAPAAPAQSKAGGTPPPGAPPAKSEGKAVKDMTDEEFARHRATWADQAAVKYSGGATG